ncbi:hypothetical protein CLTEP_22720 [Clostridium tepidiprofundi DSM 19306]|uniref:SIR2-like domain-containing protein n=1 Tax=Clostridium tepidiprofundi DSM 19306 TaxID=1121338 RepID=A0A151AX62_9CLOT|nr:hypothetical protein [Clostridium tepidiprofundi]KYH32228.1 hypothetical protein CLTEP_22720 [Clostridium tepidiprofundi DSM 19306]
MKNIALFFGAGAECSYGLPSGGKFALDIFKMDTTKDKNTLKEKMEKVDKQSLYANWLPDNFLEKRRTAFTKGQYESLVKGSLENKRNIIIDYMNHFDDNVSAIVYELQNKGININDALEKVIGSEVGKFNFSQEIRLNNILGDDVNNIFGTDYFSALLKILQKKDIEFEFKKKVKEIVRTILELLIGSLGEKLVHRLNDGIFEKSPDTMDLFDDLGAIFSLDYTGTGIKGLELIIESEEKDLKELKSNEEIILEFGRLILEDIFSRALDYQTLLDSNWRYLYNPKTDWAKFSKIVIFLYTVRRYIMSIAEKNKNKIDNGNGYYHDVLKLKQKYKISAIGTTNYNDFIEYITKEKVYYLNGSVNDFYDPYLNKIVSEEENNEKNHIIVPFLFTQSGIKPLTSVKMSERYVDIFNKFKDADIICVCGFAFNSDDGHINGMFRALIEDEGKMVYILHYAPNGSQSSKKVETEYKKKLRLESCEGLKIIQVDKNRCCNENQLLWYEVFEDKE